MGFYLETDAGNFGKVQALAAEWDGRIVDHPPPYGTLNDADEVLIVVLDNGMFEAAGVCYCESEWREFCKFTGDRPKKYLVLSKAKAIEAFAKYRPNDSARFAEALA